MTARRVAVALALLLVPVLMRSGTTAAVRHEVRGQCRDWTPVSRTEEPALYARAVDLCVEGKMRHRRTFGLFATAKSRAGAACGKAWAAVGTPISDQRRLTYAATLGRYGVRDLADDSPKAKKRFMVRCLPEQTARYEARGGSD